MAADENEDKDKVVDPFEGMIDHEAEDKKEGADDDTGEGSDDDKGGKASGKDGDDGSGSGADDADIFDGLDDDDDDDDDGGGDDDDDDDDDGGKDEDEGKAEEEKKSEDDPKDDQKKRNKKPAKKRIAQLTKRYRQAEAVADEAKKQNAELMTRLEKLEARLTDDKKSGNKEADNSKLAEGEPDPQNYKYGELDPKYVADLTDHRLDLRFKKEDDKTATKQQKVEAERKAKEITIDYNDKIKSGQDAYDDFDEVVVDAADAGEYPLTPETSMMALKSPVGHHVIYKIASDLKLAKRLAKLDPQDQARAFGRLEALFSSKKKDASRKKNKTPKTPPPPKKRSGGSGVSQRNPDTESFAEFEKNAMKDLQSEF